MDEWQSIIAQATAESRTVSGGEEDHRDSLESKVTEKIARLGASSGVLIYSLVKWYSGKYGWHGTVLYRQSVLGMATENLYDTIYDFDGNAEVESVLSPCYDEVIEAGLATLVKSGAKGRILCSEIPNLNSLREEGILVSFTEVGTVDAVDTKEESRILREVPVEIELVLHGHPNGLEVVVKVIEDDHRDALRRFKSIALEAVLKGARVIRSKTCFGGRGLRAYVDGTISGAYESTAVEIARDARVQSILYEFCDTYVRREDYKMVNSSVVYEPSDVDWLTRGRVDNGRYSLTGSVRLGSDYWLENQRSDAGGEGVENSEATIVADYLRAVYQTGVPGQTSSSVDSRIIASKMIRAISAAKDRGISAQEIQRAGAQHIMAGALIGAVYKEGMLTPDIMKHLDVDSDFYSNLLTAACRWNGYDAEELVAYSLFSADCIRYRNANVSKRRTDYAWALEGGIVEPDGVEESRGIGREQRENKVQNRTVGGEQTTEECEHYATDKIFSTLDGTNIQLTDRMVGDLSKGYNSRSAERRTGLR